MSKQPELERARAPVTSVRGSLRVVERRRSERLLLTIPIQVEGEEGAGTKFSESTRTLVINREGARIYLKHAVVPGAIVAVSTQVGKRSARFRIVGPTQPKTQEGGEWGVECLDPKTNLWGIEFPPPDWEPGMCNALIECKRCHAKKLSSLSLVEHEVLGISGLLTRSCEECGQSTSWGYSEIPTSASGLPSSDQTSAESLPASGSVHRSHGRVALQMPIRVRNYYGIEEFLRSENVSRGGLCYLSDKSYEIGEIVLVTCPYEGGGENIEIRARIVRRQERPGSGRCIYGVCYER